MGCRVEADTGVWRAARDAVNLIRGEGEAERGDEARRSGCLRVRLRRGRDQHLLAAAQGAPLASTILISIANDRIGYLPEDAAFDRPIHEVNGCPIVRGHAEDAIIHGLTAMIESELTAHTS